MARKNSRRPTGGQVVDRMRQLALSMLESAGDGDDGPVEHLCDDVLLAVIELVEVYRGQPRPDHEAACAHLWESIARAQWRVIEDMSVADRRQAAALDLGTAATLLVEDPGWLRVEVAWEMVRHAGGIWWPAGDPEEDL